MHFESIIKCNFKSTEKWNLARLLHQQLQQKSIQFVHMFVPDRREARIEVIEFKLNFVFIFHVFKRVFHAQFRIIEFVISFRAIPEKISKIFSAFYLNQIVHSSCCKILFVLRRQLSLNSILFFGALYVLS